MAGMKRDVIGKYGNGFKSGSMRLGKDALVFTRSTEAKIGSVGLLSQTFLNHVKAETVKVPILSYRYEPGSPFDEWTAVTGLISVVNDLECHVPYPLCFLVGGNHAVNVDWLLKYTAFENEVDLQNQLLGMQRGTRILVYNLADNELDFESKANDILLSGDTWGESSSSPRTLNYYYSLRDYCTIMYRVPRVSIYIREKQVKLQRMDSWFKVCIWNRLYRCKYEFT